MNDSNLTQAPTTEDHRQDPNLAKLFKSGLNFAENTPSSRAKSSLRMRYEAEARAILESLGGLEGIRLKLDLSQRKICQLLFVDPSAWTRWIKKPQTIPPHVVRALQWYLELDGKTPEWQQWRQQILKRQPDPVLAIWKKQIEQKLAEVKDNPRFEDSLRDEIRAWTAQSQKIESELNRRTGVDVGWKLLLLFNTVGLVFWLIKLLF